MRTIGDILWFVLAGVWPALGYAAGAMVMCLTLIGIPSGIQAFTRSTLAQWPSGRRIVED